MDFHFLLQDRMQKIRQINKEYNLEKNAYLSFSGGKDSTILHHLIDLAIPNNKIPRVFSNTGLEFLEIVNFVKDLQKSDERIVIIQPQGDRRAILENVGYPFKSKDFAHNLHTFQNSGMTLSVKKFTKQLPTNKTTLCPKKLMPCFTDNFKLKVSDRCCNEFKKKPLDKWGRDNKRPIAIIGVRLEEGGARTRYKDCLLFDDKNTLHKFKPLNPMSEEWENDYIDFFKIKLCKLYYEPYNFKRTGCRGCPFNYWLKDDLNTMKKLLPTDYKAALSLFRKCYEEYIKLDYRLKSDFVL